MPLDANEFAPGQFDCRAYCKSQGLLLLKCSVRHPFAPKKLSVIFSGMPTPHEPGSPIAPDLSVGVKRILEKAVLLAHLHEHRYIGTEHLLLAIFEIAPEDIMAFSSGRGPQCRPRQRTITRSVAVDQPDFLKFTEKTFENAIEAEEEGETTILLQTWCESGV